jgi:ribonuclease E
VADDDLSHDLPESSQHGEDLPDRLRVHTLARVLGTTSKRVLDALNDLDGRVRSAQSTLDKADAERVREALASSDSEPSASEPSDSEPTYGEPTDSEPTDSEPTDSEPTGDTATDESVVETSVEVVVRQADYMPLFVAPQPVQAGRDESDEETDEGFDEGESDEEPSERPASRRRRRGRRGRGRGRGEQSGDDSASDTESAEASEDQAEDTDEVDDEADEDAGSSEGASRRRRRRRRRKAGTGDGADTDGAPDDPPNTVVHERAPRTQDRGGQDKENGEIQGITGSTRLEAKRQRRRDGRDAGRRRPPILSEAEFLARREAVDRVMVVRDKVRTEPPHEGARYTQIAVLEDGVLVEHFVTSPASASLVGNIYVGIVQNVLPSMEAAFIDIGRGRNGVLYAGEVNWEAAGLGGANRKIEQALKPGDYVVVQVSKDPVGHKGARLTTQVSLAGRYLVYVPGASSTGISRKLPDTERQRLKEILREVVPADAGVIIRTASEGVKEDDIRADVARLQERWQQIEAEAAETKEKAAGAAVALYEEPDVLVKVIRDLFNEDFSGLIVSGDEAWNTINKYVNTVAPDLLPRLNQYEPASPDGPDVFAVHRIDEQLAKAMDRKVWLPSGGTLVIDRTEAMTVVDVNTGKFTGSGGNLEQTVTKNNLEAAEEIVRQLRLRDIGGIVVIDFIDMVLESNRDLVLRRLTEALARDRTRHQVSEVTSLGLVQLTRKRLGTGLIEAFSTSCPHCGGRGILLHTDPVESPPTSGRKSESRRSKRSRKARSEELAITKVPAHAPGEHPMFKAMAAANGRHTDEDEDREVTEEDVDEASEEDSDTIKKAVRELAEADLDDDDLDELDEDESDEDDEDDESDEDEDEDEDELDLYGDDEEDIDVDIEEIDSDDSDDYVDGDDQADEEPERAAPAASAVAAAPHPRRRRAAARPAGPPSHES